MTDEFATLSECDETAEAASMITNNVFADDPDKEINEFDKTTLFSSKCYKLHVLLIQSVEVHHLAEEELNTGAVPNLVRKYVILTYLVSLTGPMKISVRSAKDTTFMVNGVTRLLIEFREEFVDAVFVVSRTLTTKMTFSLRKLATKIKDSSKTAARRLQDE